MRILMCVGIVNGSGNYIDTLKFFEGFGIVLRNIYIFIYDAKICIGVNL